MTVDLRRPIAIITLSAAAFGAIVMREGYSEKAVAPVPGDVPTVGFGSTGKDIKLNDTITPVAAVQRALKDVNGYEGAIKRCVSAQLTQYEYDAYLSLAYNIGPGAFCGSTLVKYLNAGNYPAACREILKWDKFKGKPLKGLTIRREQEYQQCLGS